MTIRTTTTIVRWWSVILCLNPAIRVVIPIDGAGIQSGPSAKDAYAGGMLYDGVHRRLYVTGQTYDAGIFDPPGLNVSTSSYCFVAAINLDDWDWDDGGILMATPTSYSPITTCQTIGYVQPSSLIVGGNSEPGGFGYLGSEVMSGFAALVDLEDVSVAVDTFALIPTVERRSVEYPQFLVTSSNGKHVYVISLSAIGDQENGPDDDTAGRLPNYMTLLKHGNSFDMSVRKINLVQEEFLGVPTGPITFEDEWMKDFPVEANDAINAPPRVYVGGVIVKNDRALIVAGSTRGLGPGYGLADGDDEDGFVTVLDLQTGDLYDDDSNPMQVNNVRIGTEENDVVMGICDDPQDTVAFYIVGATTGDIDTTGDTAMSAPSGSLKAFVSRLEIGRLQTSWSRQFGARMSSDDISTLTGAFAAGCAVVGSTIYVAGGVENGAGMINDQAILESQGSDDIWTVSLNTADGSTKWMKQIGTDQSDMLSRHGGVVADTDGNVILYGDTAGSLYRERDPSDGSTDIFVMILDAEEGETAPVGQPVAPPTEAPTAPIPAPVPLPTYPPVEFVAAGNQMEGPLFAGGMVYNARDNQVWLTGATFLKSGEQSSQCVIANVNLDTGRIANILDFGAFGTNEACSAVGFSQLENLVYVVGGTQQDGFLVQNPDVNPAGESRNPDTVQFGLVLQFEPDGTKLLGGAVNQQDVVQYPIATTVGPNEDVLYVLSMSSNSPQAYNVPQGEIPNFTVGGIRPYGDAFYTVIQRYRVTSTADSPRVERVLEEEFTKKFAVVEANESVYPSGMTLAGNGRTLVVVGSTRGTGEPYGIENAEGDMDGFIFKLDPETGELQTTGERAATRLDSVNKKDDWVTNVCTDRFDHDAVYVVGKSQGKVRSLPDDEQPPEGTTHAFVAKVSLDKLTAEWLQHFTMQPRNSSDLAQASAFGCAVTSEGNGINSVYIAGTVEAGATLDFAVKTDGAGGDDIFVVQMDGAKGTINWIQQVGTSATERLAHSGGIAVDRDGNAIVFAETAGSFYADRKESLSEDSMDLVVFTMNKKDGSYKPLVQNGGEVPLPTEAPQDDPNASPPDVLPDTINALQTGPDVGPTYAGGMYYDRFTNSIYVTGATYGSFDSPGIVASTKSSCIFGGISLPQLTWREKKRYGSSDATEACSAMAMTNINEKAASIVIGSTEEGGLLTQLGTNSIPPKQYGIAMDLASVDGNFVLQGGTAIDEKVVQFPVAVETTTDGTVWILSMTSDDATVTPNYDKVSTNDTPNLTSGGIVKYGSKFSIVVERYSLVRSGVDENDGVLENSLHREWRKPFESARGDPIYASDLITLRGGKTLVAVGSTKGTRNLPDMDGVMAKIDPENGTFQSENGSRAMAYLESVSNSDDWIMGACPDPDDETSFYVVGATQGRMSVENDRDKDDVTVHAFVARIQVNDLRATWTKQFSVSHASGTNSVGAAAAAFSCDVIPGASAIYIAGTVENGATIDEGDQTSAGRDDIFVAKLWTNGGAVAWMRQVGSNGDDRIAHGGGVKVDANGNAVVFGDTNGSFFRERTDDGATAHHSDLFIMIFNQDDGMHSKPIIAGPIDELPNDTSTPDEYYPNGVEANRTTLKLISFGLIAVGLFMIAVCGVFCSRRNARKRAEAQKSSIFAYLQQFDVEDIDLRKSPPGGWHGTYLNKLAYGINKAEMSNGQLHDVDHSNSPLESAPLTHSSFVRDSLFMDISSSPSLGYRDDPDSLGLDHGYDDLKPRTYEDRSKTLKEVI